MVTSSEASSALRRARVARGESLSQAAEGTRISVTYLEALESDSPIEAFPSPPYARFFLRDYARYLGLDDEPLVEEFSRRHGLTVEPQQTEVPPVEPPPLAPIPHLRSATRRTRPIFSMSRASKRAPVPAPARVALSPGRRSHSRRKTGNLWKPAIIGLAVVALVAALVRFQVLPALDDDGSPAASPSAGSGAGLAELPRGGRTIFPDFRVVAFYGAARTESLGILGIGPDLAVEQLTQQAAAYDRPGRPVLPAFELIATVASDQPGDDGKYRSRQSDFLIGGYLDAAREARFLLILDIQPGRSDFMTEVRVLRKYLMEPDVGLAIDPEWHVEPGQVPGEQLGSTDAKTINRVSAYLARIVREHDLPQKLFIIHQFTSDMIRDKNQVKQRAELAMTFDVDGIGDRPNKVSKYEAFTRGYRKKFHHGIKLYYQADENLMTPQAVLRLDPEPDLIVYQ